MIKSPYDAAPVSVPPFKCADTPNAIERVTGTLLVGLLMSGVGALLLISLYVLFFVEL